jgi:hypothetical protein
LSNPTSKIQGDTFSYQRISTEVWPKDRNAAGLKSFQSQFAASLQRFLDIKRALGRQYAVEAATLSHWDAFLMRQYPQARKVRAEMFFGWIEELVHLSSVVRRNHQRVVRKLSFVSRPRSWGHVYSGHPDFSEIHTSRTTPISLRH